MSNFNYIAPYYDLLAKCVFGHKLYQAKMCFISAIKPDSYVLIIGGGTGDILNELLMLTENTKIDFIESSSTMIRMAKQKLNQNFITRVNFISGDHLSLNQDEKYNVVISHFIFDVFKQFELIEFSERVNNSLQQNGVWLFTDFFYTKNIFQRLMIWLMYRCFKITADISADRLPEYELVFKNLNVEVKNERHFLNGMVKSKILKKKHKL